VAAVGLLVSAGVLALLPAGVLPVPLVEPLEGLPATLAGWTATLEPLPAVLPPDVNAPFQLGRTYRRDRTVVWVSVAYYPDQREGRRPPARELLFPVRGWTELEERRVSLPLGPAREALGANLVVMTREGQRFAILYWYQLGRRPVASDFWNRASLLYNRVVRRRADGAFVRIASAVPPGASPDETVRIAAEFLHGFYPALLRALPA
jgi:EpsI family protein